MPLKHGCMSEIHVEYSLYTPVFFEDGSRDNVKIKVRSWQTYRQHIMAMHVTLPTHMGTTT